jgi:hypothetical protein
MSQPNLHTVGIGTSKPVPLTTTNAETDQFNLGSTCLWNDYLRVKEHFPESISACKEEFFRKLALLLPPNEQAEIQSYDGSTIDALWDDLSVSLTESDALSASTNNDFEYFEYCLADSCIEFIVRSQRTKRQFQLDQFRLDDYCK